ncbi:hypothetical protein IOD14_43930 (plasmid) [Streptomyces sp. A2-16]|uniref:hypothetical protein n=1 Tax=Streptomyces sp. A2-16 TaxID=2781734 RepID=UPI001BAF359F|nr:hypothetical protein [Streptomyces sp. A2-16]QUC63799.1 hypothetical protein IOD14_43930 [Streptomyces sp. A2-16]
MTAPTPAVPWSALAADPATVARYEAKVYRGPGPTDCHWWLGAVSDSGHGKLRAGSRPAGTSRVVSAHVLGFAIHHGAGALQGAIVRHRCDEASCQNPAHWLAGDRLQNILDFQARRGLTGHPLADVRGAAGRAVAVRDAILAAAPGAEADAIVAALAAGHPSGDRQDTLW